MSNDETVRKTAIGTVTVIAVVVGLCCLLPCVSFVVIGILGNLGYEVTQP